MISLSAQTRLLPPPAKAVEELTATFAGKRSFLKQLEKTQSEELARLEAEHEILANSESQPQQILESQAAIADAQARLDAVLDEIDELNRREGILRNEAHAAPADQGLRAAHDYSVAVGHHLDGLRNRIQEAEDHVRQKQVRLDEVRQQGDREVTDLGIDKWLDDLDSLKDGITAYRFAILFYGRPWSLSRKHEPPATGRGRI